MIVIMIIIMKSALPDSRRPMSRREAAPQGRERTRGPPSGFGGKLTVII